MSGQPELHYAGFDVLALYHTYDSELRAVARKLRKVSHNMQQRGHGVGISDIEGELLYMLVRETHPTIVFEISPDCGWSTNYLLAALTENGHGLLHSFEIEPVKYGKPIETAVRSNQHPDWDQKRLQLHIGNARENVPLINGPIDFLFIDSCHEAWFAEWYIETVFPRVCGPIFMQDIAFSDGLEPSSEATYVWDWAIHNEIRLALVGRLEQELRSRRSREGYAERRNLRSNSVVITMPQATHGSIPELFQSPAALID